MNNVLVVEDSINLLRSIKLELSKYKSQINLHVSENGEDAIKTLKEIPISVLVTDLYMPKVDGLDLLAFMSRNYPQKPCIVMTAFGSPEIMEILDNLGIYRFLEKPFDSKDLINAITDAISQINKGEPIKRLSIPGFLRLLQEEQRTCTLETINQNTEKGYFHIIDGRLYDAQCGNIRGEAAAISILGWDKVSFNIKDLPKKDIQARINLSLKALISKGQAISTNKTSSKEEAQKVNIPEILFQAIRNAESGKTSLAQKSLSKILKIDPKNSKAWLWFSRTATNLKAIKIALKNGAIISPDDPEIDEELRKVTSAEKYGCGDSGKITHCFFCWAPVEHDSATCHYCNAHLDIHEDIFHSNFFSSENEPDLKVILGSFQRFTKAIILDQNNVKAHYFLAIAHINLNQYDEALEELKKAKAIDPDNYPYKIQLDSLSHFMEGLGSFFSNENPDDVTTGIAEKATRTDKIVMVVEDSSTTRTIITRMLTAEGYKVIEAKDGVEAVAKFAEVQPDLILLDIIMPGMDGYQTLTTLKKKHNLGKIPIIMLSAKDSLIDKLRGKMSGSTEYLTKPFSALELIKKIRTHLN